MTDHKASIKIEFSIYGETYKMDSWINWGWMDSPDNIDKRVLDFFRKSFDKARDKYDQEQAAYFRRVNKEKTEKAERDMLNKLKAKYEPSSGEPVDTDEPILAEEYDPCGICNYEHCRCAELNLR